MFEWKEVYRFLTCSGSNLSYCKLDKPLSFNPSLKDWANSQLRLAISQLRSDSYEDFPEAPRVFKDALFCVYIIQSRLVDAGAAWQAQRVAVWVKRARKQGGFLS